MRHLLVCVCIVYGPDGKTRNLNAMAPCQSGLQGNRCVTVGPLFQQTRQPRSWADAHNISQQSGPTQRPSAEQVLVS